MCTWHPETATALPNTDLSKINQVNTINANAGGYYNTFRPDFRKMYKRGR
jgi:hypothetical protein